MNILQFRMKKVRVFILPFVISFNFCFARIIVLNVMHILGF